MIFFPLVEAAGVRMSFSRWRGFPEGVLMSSATFSAIKTITIICILQIATIAGAQSLPWDESSMFTGSGNCAHCHSSNGAANTENGTDISMPTQWRGTMMANAARDPLWRAKVSAEIDEFPQFQVAIETKCIRCHAPMAHEQAMHDGQTDYSLVELESDPLALDGVSCTLCHQVEPDNFGLPQSYSGHFELDETRQIYGPYTNPLTGPMMNNSNFMPVHSEHMGESELCATCHTLFTAYVGNDGQLTGSFPEQTPYLEWKNSTFGQNNVECQACHMLVADTAQDIATMPPWHTETHEPFAKHEFTGANEFMLNILKNNITELGLTASEANFDDTLARTRLMLENQTVGLSAMHFLTEDTLSVDLMVENFCGHKLPTGIPLRRMWIHLKVLGGDAEVIFESGNWDEDGEVIGLDEGFEPHHDMINHPDQVQIYEPVMMDVNGDLTYTLLRAAGYLKDNRLPPVGFTSSHSAYDSTAIEGAALQDADFNRSGGVEGSGSDTVHYRIPVSSGGPFLVEVEVCYQTLTPRMFNDIASHDTPEVHVFAPMYEEADKAPSLLGGLTLDIGSASGVEHGGLPLPVRLNQNVPNPFNPATMIFYEVKSERSVRLDIFDMSGQLVRQLVSETQPAGSYSRMWDGTDDHGGAVASGLYLYRLSTGEHQISRRMTLVR